MSRKRFAVSQWSLRRKLALALTIPMLLAAVLGGLRVHSELVEAGNHTATASQVTVLRPAVAFLAAAEHAAVVSRESAVDSPELETAVAAASYAGDQLEQARSNPDLTTAQRRQLDSVLDLSGQLRDTRAYLSLGQAVSQVRQLHRGVTQLVSTIVDAQIEPEPRLRTLGHVLDGRLSLSMQQLLVAYDGGEGANPIELAAEVGVEAAAIERLGVALGSTEPTVLALRQQNARHFGTIRGGGTDLGGPEAYAGYDLVTRDLLDQIDAQLSAATERSRDLVVINAAGTTAALLFAIVLALMVSRLLLTPIRRVREGALELAHERLPQMVRRIRAGEQVEDVEPIGVETHEEMGQLARAVDELTRQAVTLASGEAAVRSRVGEMFVTLSRRTTSLINQQLALIEALESDEEDPQRLESLFRLDHLASRMRRTADSLMVLADAPTRGDAEPLSVADSLHAASAGVQHYQRVQILAAPEDPINASAAADVVHLLTELVDNALAYSPPTAPVLVVTASQGATISIQISDAGLGVPEADLAAINADLESGGEVTPDTARRMGLLVVSRLARRHGITVRLDRNERGGTTATVVLPASVLSRTVATEAGVERAAEPAPPTPVGAKGKDKPARKDVAEPGDPVPSRPAFEQVEAAINAALGLPQRSPGATGAGAPPLPQREPAAAPPVLSVVPGDGPGASSGDGPEPVREPAEPLAVLPTRLPAPPEPAAPEPVVAAEVPEVDVEVPEVLEVLEVLETVVETVVVPESPEVLVQGLVEGALEGGMPPESPGALDARTPASTGGDEDSPIFRALRSNWLTGGTGSDAGWTSPEIEAGWEAADRVTVAPAAQVGTAGLPMRRPGNRLVPGGVTSQTSAVARDPEAIRARLAAHSAGVARGRSAAADVVPTDTSEQEAGTS